MDSQTCPETQSPSILDHDLNRHFPELLTYGSMPELAASVLWTEIREHAERVLNAVVVEEFAEATEPGASIAALAWNIERGIVFDGIIDALQNHQDLRDKDVLLRTELDYGMARSGNRFVAKEIAKYATA